MRKTLLQVILLLTVLSLVLSACGGGVEEVGGFQIPAVKDGKFNVAMVLIGPHDDGGWSQAHYEGLLYIEENVPDVNIAYVENVPEGADSEQVFRALARKGFDMIFGTSFGFGDPMEIVAGEFPYTMFIHLTGIKFNRPSFTARLVNPPFHDPGLLISFQFQRRAMLFHLGDLHALSPRALLKISHVFVTHKHVDHFVGFDTLLRVSLGREKEVHLFGPVGFFERVEGKLAGYTWNLVDEYPYNLQLSVTEVDEERCRTRRYLCKERFQRTGDDEDAPFARILVKEPAFRVEAALLDHRISCLGLSLIGEFSDNIDKEALKFLGLPVIDRAPIESNSTVLNVHSTVHIHTSVDALLHRSWEMFPSPPQDFNLSPDVETMYIRYRAFREGRESPLSMSYMCLTVLEASAGGRAIAATKYFIAKPILDMLGKLCSEKGRPDEARKTPTHGAYVSLSDNEKDWIAQVIKAIIDAPGNMLMHRKLYCDN